MESDTSRRRIASTAAATAAVASVAGCLGDGTIEEVVENEVEALEVSDLTLDVHEVGAEVSFEAEYTGDEDEIDIAVDPSLIDEEGGGVLGPLPEPPQTITAGDSHTITKQIPIKAKDFDDIAEFTLRIHNPWDF